VEPLLLSLELPVVLPMLPVLPVLPLFHVPFDELLEEPLLYAPLLLPVSLPVAVPLELPLFWL
jgi:hypothetical protein